MFLRKVGKFVTGVISQQSVEVYFLQDKLTYKYSN